MNIKLFLIEEINRQEYILVTEHGKFLAIKKDYPSQYRTYTINQMEHIYDSTSLQKKDMIKFIDNIQYDGDYNVENVKQMLNK